MNEPVCAVATAPGATTCPENGGIRVHLTTSNDSPLSGEETVYLRITAEDNNGSWELTVEPEEGQRVENPGAPYGLVYEWTNIKLDKPGAYKLHTYYTDWQGYVYLDDGSHLLIEPEGLPDDPGNWVQGTNTVGIDFPAASSQKFIVNP